MLGKQASDLCSSTLTQYFVNEYFGEGRWGAYIDSLIEVYRARRDAMLESLERHFPPQATWTTPEGGLFVWATLPDYFDTTDLLARALRENVAFVPGRGRVRGRARDRLDAAQLLGLDRGRDPRGNQADRRGRRASRSSCSRASPASTEADPGRPD